MIKKFGIAFLVFFVMDMIWLGVIAKNFYREQLGFLMKTNINWIAAVSFYIIFIVGLVVFVIGPAIQKGNWKAAIYYGAFFGLVTYATYDLTNLATLKDWPIKMSLVDIAWGMFLSASVSVSTFFIITKWTK
jgi:uncharacterized membrane protein